jgi:hypothetical protein
MYLQLLWPPLIEEHFAKVDVHLLVLVEIVVVVVVVVVLAMVFAGLPPLEL